MLCTQVVPKNISRHHGPQLRRNSKDHFICSVKTKTCPKYHDTNRRPWLPSRRILHHGKSTDGANRDLRCICWRSLHKIEEYAVVSKISESAVKHNFLFSSQAVARPCQSSICCDLPGDTLSFEHISRCQETSKHFSFSYSRAHSVSCRKPVESISECGRVWWPSRNKTNSPILTTSSCVQQQSNSYCNFQYEMQVGEIDAIKRCRCL